MALQHTRLAWIFCFLAVPQLVRYSWPVFIMKLVLLFIKLLSIPLAIITTSTSGITNRIMVAAEKKRMSIAHWASLFEVQAALMDFIYEFDRDSPATIRPANNWRATLAVSCRFVRFRKRNHTNRMIRLAFKCTIWTTEFRCAIEECVSVPGARSEEQLESSC